LPLRLQRLEFPGPGYFVGGRPHLHCPGELAHPWQARTAVRELRRVLAAEGSLQAEAQEPADAPHPTAQLHAMNGLPATLMHTLSVVQQVREARLLAREDRLSSAYVLTGGGAWFGLLTGSSAVRQTRRRPDPRDPVCRRRSEPVSGRQLAQRSIGSYPRLPLHRTLGAEGWRHATRRRAHGVIDMTGFECAEHDSPPRRR
jgi:hypothetical protein